MSTEFARGLHDVADDVARAHSSGPGLPVSRIDTRARRARRRHEVALVVASGAAVVAVVLAGAALVDRTGAVPPAVTPSESPSASVSPSPKVTPSPEVTPTPDSTPTPGERIWDADDLDALVIDPATLAAILPGLEGLPPTITDVPLGEWGLHPDIVIYPGEECRAALTVVADPPVAYGRAGWASDPANAGQEFVVLADADAAAAAFAALGSAHQACPEYGAALPESSGAWFTVGDVATDTTGLPSYRVAGTEAGEGHENAWLLVDVLVDNVIVRTEVFRYDGPSAATADEAAAVGDAVVQALEAARAARQS